jgi:hypothetical protein
LSLCAEGAVAWHAFRIDEIQKGIFDTFEGPGRAQAYVDG